MSRRGSFLLEGIVSLSVALTVGLALLSMLVSLYRLEGRSSDDQLAQGVLDSALAETLESTAPTTTGRQQAGDVLYSWRGGWSKQAGNVRVATVTVSWKQRELTGQRVRLP